MRGKISHDNDCDLIPKGLKDVKPLADVFLKAYALSILGLLDK